jgi:carboxypeptidase PM20D1
MKEHEKIGPNGLEAIFDEGPMMVEGALPGIKGPVALVANAEKGAITVELSLEAPGGHSSMPPIKEQGR